MPGCGLDLNYLANDLALLFKLSLKCLVHQGLKHEVLKNKEFSI
jgi:hypothetical protein